MLYGIALFKFDFTTGLYVSAVVYCHMLYTDKQDGYTREAVTE